MQFHASAAKIEGSEQGRGHGSDSGGYAHLIHDRQTFDAAGLRSGLRDIDNLRIKVTQSPVNSS